MNKLNKIFLSSKKLDIDKSSKIVIMSDCHRGDGNNEDNFSKNEVIFNGALKQYYRDGYTYIELGDGDELWEVKDIKSIVEAHKSTYKILDNFYKDNRLYMIYGNHDNIKRNSKNFYLDNLKNIEFLESINLKYNDINLFLLHGHQVELLHTKFINVSAFLVRYVWKYFERFGINDPTSAAKNNRISVRNHKKLLRFANENNIILISGHTHKPTLNEKELYINSGSCVHPNGITALEIEHGFINLVRWKMGVGVSGTTKIEKEKIASVLIDALGNIKN